MLIETSISWLMSANWANEFVAAHDTGVEAEEERRNITERHTSGC